MEKIMNIYDIFSADDGSAVLAGTDSALDLLDFTTIKHKIGSSIIVKFDDKSESSVFSVAGIDVSHSLLGKKNIFVKLEIPISKIGNLKNGEIFVNS